MEVLLFITNPEGYPPLILRPCQDRNIVSKHQQYKALGKYMIESLLKDELELSKNAFHQRYATS